MSRRRRRQPALPTRLEIERLELLRPGRRRSTSSRRCSPTSARRVARQVVDRDASRRRWRRHRPLARAPLRPAGSLATARPARSSAAAACILRSSAARAVESAGRSHASAGHGSRPRWPAAASASRSASSSSTNRLDDAPGQPCLACGDGQDRTRVRPRRRPPRAAALLAPGRLTPAAASAGQDRQQRLQLDLGLGQLGRRVGVAHDADARVAARDRARAAARSAARRRTRRPRSRRSSRPGPAYQPRSRPSSAGISGAARRQRLAADGRRRVQQARRARSR